MDHQRFQQAGTADPSLIDRVARLESGVVDSCRRIEDQHLAAASLRERLHQVDSDLHASGDRLETILRPAPEPPPQPACPEAEPVHPPPRPSSQAPRPVGTPPGPCAPRPAPAPIEARDDERIPPFLLPYLALLAVGMVLPWIGARLPGRTASGLPERPQAPADAPGSGLMKDAAAEPLPPPDDSRERALRLVYSFSPPGRKETVFDLLLRSSPPALREDVERVDQDSYLVTFGGVKLGPGEGPARFEANLAEGTVSMVKEDAGTGSGTAQSATSGR